MNGNVKGQRLWNVIEFMIHVVLSSLGNDVLVVE